MEERNSKIDSLIQNDNEESETTSKTTIDLEILQTTQNDVQDKE